MSPHSTTTRKNENLSTDDLIRQAICAWGLAAGAPDGRIAKTTLERELDLSEAQLEEIVATLGMLSDSVTGARLIVDIDGDDVVLEGTSGNIPPFRLSDSGSILLENLLKQGRFDAESSRRIVGALSSRSEGSSTDNEIEATEYTGARFFQALCEAREYGMRCRMRYRSLNDGEPRWRLIDPGFFFSENGRSYLAAWDVERDVQRHYRMDRIEDVQTTEDSVEQHPFEHISIQQSLSENGEKAIISIPDASYLERFEWTGVRMDKISAAETSTERMVYEVGYSSEASLFNLILAGGGDIVLLSPADLRERFLAHGRKLLGDVEHDAECRCNPGATEGDRETDAPEPA